MNITEQLENEGFSKEQINFAIKNALNDMPFAVQLEELRGNHALSKEEAERLVQKVSEYKKSLTPDGLKEEKGNGSILSRLISIGLIIYVIIKIANGRGNIVDYGFLAIAGGLLLYGFVNKKL